jgi:hypothetical protein
MVGILLVQTPPSLAWFCATSRVGLQAIEQRRREATPRAHDGLRQVQLPRSSGRVSPFRGQED